MYMSESEGLQEEGDAFASSRCDWRCSHISLGLSGDTDASISKLGLKLPHSWYLPVLI